MTARQFPGISATTLDSAPPTITAQTRRFTAEELVENTDLVENTEQANAGLLADVGEIRSRLIGDGAPAAIASDTNGSGTMRG